MINYTIRRVLAAIPVLFGILIVTFVLNRLIPADPCVATLGEHSTPERCATFMHAKGLDQPIYTQLVIYMASVFQGDLGNSIRYSRPVWSVLTERLPMTLELSVTAFCLALLIGVPAGILSARYHNSLVDVSAMVGANIGVSMPVFWLGLMLATLFALVLKGTPFSLPPSNRLTAGISSIPFYDVYKWHLDKTTAIYQIARFFGNLYLFNSIITLNFKALWDTIKHLILPAAALATIPLSIIARITRSSLLEVLGLDYVRTARAKGLTQRVVLMKHAFRNALLPVVTVMGLQLGGLMSGAVLTETVFGLAGVGSALVDAILQRDYPVVQGFTLIIATIYVLINLVVDLSYAFFDPRIRFD